MNGAHLQNLQAQLRFAERLLPFDSDGIIAFDDELRCFYWSARLERLTGLSSERVLGQTAGDALPFLGETDDIEALRRARAGERIVSTERPWHVHETQRSGFFDATYTSIGIGDGGDHTSVLGVSAVIRDVTRERRTKATIAETEARFRNMADASPVLLWMTGTDALCTFFNATWLAFTGRTLLEELGVGWAEGIHFEDFQAAMDAYLSAFEERRTFEIEYRLRRHDGEYRVLLDRGTPRYALDGKFAGYVGSCVDITGLKQLEIELRRRVKERDDFLSIASHELRTPLTALQLHLERLAMATASAQSKDDKAHRLVTKATSQVGRLASLVDELLEMSHLASGGLHLRPVDVDLAAVVCEAVGRLEYAAEAAACALNVVSQPVMVACDRSRIDRVVSNLVTNAFKYGSGKPIDVWVGPVDSCAVLRVRDHGIGIDVGDQRRIFERFERAVSNANYGGFGLGLWISNEIVTKHGGSIAVDSKPGDGAEFTVRLPVKGVPS